MAELGSEHRLSGSRHHFLNYYTMPRHYPITTGGMPYFEDGEYDKIYVKSLLNMICSLESNDWDMSVFFNASG